MHSAFTVHGAVPAFGGGTGRRADVEVEATAYPHRHQNFSIGSVGAGPDALQQRPRRW